jgi:hypothetical protein
LIYTYGFTQRGIAHAKRNLVCQDAHAIREINENLCVAAVADGLGSELYSDIASRIAVDVAIDVCSEEINENKKDRDIICAIKKAFIKALEAIQIRAMQDQRDINQYDTTLSLAVLKENNLFFGHSGDSGIIALGEDGKFYNVTKQQRDSEGRVFPLCFGEKYWKFGKFENSVVSILLATDGMYELFFPIYLKEEAVNIYTSLAKFFLDPYIFIQQEINEDEIKQRRELYMEKLPEEVVDDDKTLVVAINTDVDFHMQAEDYYKEPNWEKLIQRYKNRFNEKAYDLQDTNNGIKQ